MGRFVCRIEPPRVGGSEANTKGRAHRSDEILRHAEKKQQTPNPNAPAATAPAPGPASTGLRPATAPLQRVNGAPSSRSPLSAGVASSAPIGHPASNLAATYRNNPPQNMRPGPGPGGLPSQGGSRAYPGQAPMRPPPQQGGYDPRSVRGAPPPPGHGQGQPQARGAYAGGGRRF